MNKENSIENKDSGADKADKRKREIRSWIISLSVAIIIALGLRLFVFEFIIVSGSSMEPTLRSGEYMFAEKVTYYFNAPSRGDIIICTYPNDLTCVKRVIGLPGDVLEIKDGTLYINGAPSSDYFKGNINILPDPNPVTVPSGCVYVMGDNRNDSEDSRDKSVGPIPYSRILGRAVFVIWPLDKIHGL